MKINNVLGQYSKEKIKINPWIEDDIFFVEGNIKHYYFYLI